MITEIGNYVTVKDPPAELLAWCKANLVLPNPEYANKVRMHLWVGNTPKTISLYLKKGDTLILPFGTIRSVFPFLKGDISTTFKKLKEVNYHANVPLYDYQEEAVSEMVLRNFGILQSPAGSGKTQMGIALAAELGVKTLWLTHTKDLLTQSRTRAEQYIDNDLIGTITEGKVNIGCGITFATIQTMCNVDLELFKDEWDCIIVDECHRVSGSPATVTRFSKVLNALRARHKYGLSATVHRADGLIKATYAYLGEVIWSVPEKAVESRIMKAEIEPINTEITGSRSYLNSDGTINYSRLITYLTEIPARNEMIVNDLVENSDHYNLILSDRVKHLRKMYSMLPPGLQECAAVIDGKMTSKTQKAEREQAIEDMRNGKKHYLFATYNLCKEGLDIPRLDRLYMTTPVKDYAVVIQSLGRIARVFDGKETPIVYDYVDAIRYCLKAFKTRCTHYRKAGAEIK